MLEASQLGFQEAVMNQIQSLTDQMTLMVRSQQPSLPPSVESGRLAYGVCNVVNRVTLSNFVEWG